MTTNRPEFQAHDDFIFEHKEVGKVTREEFIKYIRSSHEHMRKLSQIIQQYNQTIDEYLNEWDGNLESFDDDVKDLLGQWIQDGTMDHIINENLMSTKADKSYVDDLNENVTAQLAHKVDKGNVSVHDINKNLGRFDETYFSDAFNERLNGGSLNVTNVEDYSLTTKKYSLKSITPATTNFVEVGKNKFDKNEASPNGQWIHYNTGVRQFYPENQHIEGLFTSNYILVTPGEKISINTRWNSYVTLDASMNRVSGSVFAPGFIEIPSNARYLVVNFHAEVSDRDHIQIEKNSLSTAYEPFSLTLRDSKNSRKLAKLEELLMSNSTRNLKLLNLPEKYELVVGDTLELFYKGILFTKDIKNYFITVKSSKGKAYERKYIFEPQTSDVGTYDLTVQIHDDNDVLLDSGSVNLVVKNKATNPETTQNILAVGDSLTAGGQWVTELHNRLVNQDEVTNLKFVGTKGTAPANFEATGGWTLSRHLSSESAFWNSQYSKIDFSNYATEQGITTIDHVYILLGWNDTSTTELTYKNNLRTFVDKLRTDFPNSKVTLIGLQVPSVDGLGHNYGATWGYKDTLKFVFRLNEWLIDVSKEYTNIDFIHLASQFDSEYNMPSSERNVNVRSSIKERYGINGVHPAESGYLQIADAVYRNITHKL